MGSGWEILHIWRSIIVHCLIHTCITCLCHPNCSCRSLPEYIYIYSYINIHKHDYHTLIYVDHFTHAHTRTHTHTHTHTHTQSRPAPWCRVPVPPGPYVGPISPARVTRMMTRMMTRMIRYTTPVPAWLPGRAPMREAVTCRVSTDSDDDPRESASLCGVAGSHAAASRDAVCACDAEHAVPRMLRLARDPEDRLGWCETYHGHP